MDINLLLQGVECACGRKHVCNIKHVYIENRSHLRLPELCRVYIKKLFWLRMKILMVHVAKMS